MNPHFSFSMGSFTGLLLEQDWECGRLCETHWSYLKWHATFLPVSCGPEFRGPSIFSWIRVWKWDFWGIFNMYIPNCMLNLAFSGPRNGMWDFEEWMEFKQGCKDDTNPVCLASWYEGRLRYTEWHRDLPRHRGTTIGRGSKGIAPWSWVCSSRENRFVLVKPSNLWWFVVSVLPGE